MTETYFAETLAQFMKSIDRIEKACKPKKAYEPELWYRGAQKCDWKLVPKLYRCNFRV